MWFYKYIYFFFICIYTPKEGEYLSSLIKKCSINLYNNIKRELPQEFENLSDYQVIRK